MTTGTTEAPTVRDLFDAARAGDVGRVEAIVAVRPRLVETVLAQDDELTALHAAVMGRHEQVVRVLIRAGANPERGVYPHRKSTTPRVMAFDRDFEEITRAIDEELQAMAAVKSGQSPASSSVAPPDLDPLLAAIDAGDAAVVQRCIDDRHRKLASNAESCAFLATRAVKADQPEILEMLLDAGIDPDDRNRIHEYEGEVYSWGQPLCIAAGSGKIELARMLLDAGADPNGEFYASGRPLSWAYNNRDQAMIALLQSRGATMTAWMAASEGQPDLLERALADDPAAVDAVQAGDALGNAVCGGEPECVRIILDLRSVPVPPGAILQCFRIWRTESHRRFRDFDRSKYLQIGRMLLEAGADPNGLVKPTHGWSLLHNVVEERDHRLTADEQVAFAELLLEYGARLNTVDTLLQSTPLGWAARWGQAYLVDLFLSHGADPHLAGAQWATPLAWARRYGHDSIVSRLTGGTQRH